MLNGPKRHGQAWLGSSSHLQALAAALPTPLGELALDMTLGSDDPPPALSCVSTLLQPCGSGLLRLKLKLKRPNASLRWGKLLAEALPQLRYLDIAVNRPLNFLAEVLFHSNSLQYLTLTDFDYDLYPGYEPDWIRDQEVWIQPVLVACAYSKPDRQHVLRLSVDFENIHLVLEQMQLMWHDILVRQPAAASRVVVTAGGVRL